MCDGYPSGFIHQYQSCQRSELGMHFNSSTCYAIDDVKQDISCCPSLNLPSYSIARQRDRECLQVWAVTAVGAVTPPANTPTFAANGQYQIINTARGSCSAYLGTQQCTQGNGVSLGGGGIFPLSPQYSDHPWMLRGKKVIGDC
jgi:hypothetical protein